MQVTVNVVSLPPVVVDAFNDMLNASVTPIFAEDALPSKAQSGLVEMAYFACSKSICMKFMPELEEAGLFKDVVSIDFPSFKWTRGMKFCYAVDMIMACLVKTMAEEMVKGKEFNSFIDFLEAWRDIRIDKSTGDLLEHVEGPAARRLEEHALGLATANANLMVGETPTIMLQTLNDIKRAMEAGTDPLATLAINMEYLQPNQAVYL
jgi:hypothetical protein